MIRSPALLAGMAALLLAGCSGGAPEPSAEQAAAAPKLADGAILIKEGQLTRMGIRFAAALRADEVPLGSVPAIVAPPPNARVAVAATLPGVVTRTLVVEGDIVRAGQPLAIVSSREMLGIGAALERARARAEVADATDRRQAQLAREGVIAGARADEARAARREAQAELVEQRRVVGLVNGSPARGSYTLTAPIAGRVTTATIQTGSPVDGNSAPYVIDAADRYEVSAQLPERLIGRVRAGMAVELSGGVRGTVTSVGTVLDPATRSASLRARLPAAPGIVSGRAASVTLFGPAAAGAVTVPTSAVTTMGAGQVVFVRTPAGVVARKVEVVGTSGAVTVIGGGLRVGERVAIAGTSELKALAGGG